MNAEQELAEALGYTVDFERFNACIRPRDSAFDRNVMQFVTLAANRQYALSVTANEDAALGDVFEHVSRFGTDESAEGWGGVHIEMVANFQARAAAALDEARALAPVLVELGVLKKPTDTGEETP